MKTKFGKSRKNQTIIVTVLLLAILIVVNIVSIRLFGRIDLTKQGLFTLSDASKNLVKKLNDRVTIKVYFTDNLPAPYNNHRRALIDLLNEYRAFGGNNFFYEFINPESENGQEEAKRNGIPTVEAQVYNEDKLEVKKACMGMALFYQDRKETISVIQNIENLEYDISSSLTKLLRKEQLQIGFTLGHGEDDLGKMQTAAQTLSQQYAVIPVDLAKVAEIPSAIKVLLIIDPKEQFNDSAKYTIDQYLMNGGRIALLYGNVKIDPYMQNPYGQLIPNGLEDMLTYYGIGINPDLIRDAQCGTIGVIRQSGGYQFQTQVQFPYLPLVSNFLEGNIIVKDLKGVVFQFASSIDTSLAAAKGIKVHPFAFSTTKAGRESGRFAIDPFHQYTAADFPERYIPMAAIFEGSFNSFFVGREPAAKVQESPETRIIAVGSGQFMNDNLGRYRDNMTFFANIVDYLADDKGLISIRAKNSSMADLDETSEKTRRFLKYGNMILPPLLVIVFGLLRWRRRIAFKRTMESQM